MRTAQRLVLPCVLLFAGLVLACGGGDDDDDNDATPAATPTASRVTSTPERSGDEKSPPPEESPNEGETPNGTETPLLSPAAEGTPAVAPDDQVRFIEQFGGRDVEEEDCTYNPQTRVTDCASNGLYAVDPPPAGEDVTCAIGIVDGDPEYIRCRSVQQAIYYDIQN